MGTLKVLLALLMILGGVDTLMSPLEPIGSAIVNNRVTLVLFGLFYIISGIALLLGKIVRNRRLVGRSLMAIYLVTLFTVLLEWTVTAAFLSVVDNLVVVVWAAGLWLWWKHKTEWISGKDIARYRRTAKQINS